MSPKFITPSRSLNRSMGPRDWGHETLIHLSPSNWSLKKIFINKGSKGGLQYHRKKDEAAYLVSGSLLVRYVDISGDLKEEVFEEGSSFHFPPGCIHQEEALTDCLLLEVSTPHCNDRVRVDSNYGLPIDGLPTTKEKDISEINL